MDDIKSIGVNIREARKAAGITQGTLADLIGTSSRTVHAIENGTGNPSLRAVTAAANAVGLHVRAAGPHRPRQCGFFIHPGLPRVRG
ncbi:helix-turn-helix transcriptional regulator [Arthrobacter sp. ISL-65]|uniref:helix-turn-helix transcriptional regulator n=1 Tax=Arthrobacter sp. ISL-65 TaxID=2819112 RepID=UPI001BEB8ADC|nr:helix-turn-helix transcriptional regulator [Arthrobacter sp. ISL-65]MBT2549994.1 helix-turn-helix transcriptional regulator [Arthrobacter sp. ISL-65]